jgi:hypothetical protein
VRVWGNYIDHTFVGIGTTVAHFGPIYVFRNVVNRSRRNHMSSQPEDDQWNRGAGFKAYGRATPDNGATYWGGGRQYFFNNTFLQQPGNTYSPVQASDLGIGVALTGAGSNPGMRENWSRNNIFHIFRTWGSSIRLGQSALNNNLDYDLHTETVDSSETPGGTYESNGVGPDIYPQYNATHGWSAYPRLTAEPAGQPEAVWSDGHAVGEGNFQLQTSPASPGLNAGTPLPNFTYDIDNAALAAKSGVAVGGTPDIGAHDSASGGTMKFGLPAAQ